MPAANSNEPASARGAVTPGHERTRAPKHHAAAAALAPPTSAGPSVAASGGRSRLYDGRCSPPYQALLHTAKPDRLNSSARKRWFAVSDPRQPSATAIHASAAASPAAAAAGLIDHDGWLAPVRARGGVTRPRAR